MWANSAAAYGATNSSIVGNVEVSLRQPNRHGTSIAKMEWPAPIALARRNLVESGVNKINRRLCTAFLELNNSRHVFWQSRVNDPR